MQKKTLTRVCYLCKVLLTDSKGKPLPAVELHCGSPTCDYCMPCRRSRSSA